jgi:hypothetical protein
MSIIFFATWFSSFCVFFVTVFVGEIPGPSGSGLGWWFSRLMGPCTRSLAKADMGRCLADYPMVGFLIAQIHGHGYLWNNWLFLKWDKKHSIIMGL